MRAAPAALSFGVWMLEWSLHVGHAWRVTIDNSHAENSFVADHDVRVGNSQFGDEAVGVDCTTANFHVGPQTFAPFDASLVLELNRKHFAGVHWKARFFFFRMIFHLGESKRGKTSLTATSSQRTQKQRILHGIQSGNTCKGRMQLEQ